MAYVDGFVLAVPKTKLKAYQKISKAAGKVWREHGALEYRECVGDDLNIKMGFRFPSWPERSRVRPSSSPGSSTRRGRCAIGSTRRS